MHTQVAIFEDDGIQLEKIVEKTSRALKIDKPSILGFRSSEDVFEFIKSKKHCDLFIVDIYENENPIGIKIIHTLRLTYPKSLKIIAHSMSEDPEKILEAMRAGASDFVLKTTGDAEFLMRIKNSTLLEENTQQPISYSGSKVVGQSLNNIKQSVPGILKSAIKHVLITGEPGSGKELVAEILKGFLPTHTPFITINCSNLTEELAVSELFGHRKGAFTGALSDKTGLLEKAHGGWVFFDEIANLPLKAQNYLLRFLENSVLRRLGDNSFKSVETRCLFATNQDLIQQIDQGRFKMDLLSRINEHHIALLPLRARKADIPALARHFCNIEKGGPYHLTESAVKILESLDWRMGNARELRSFIRNMTVKAKNKVLDPSCMPNIDTGTNIDHSIKSSSLSFGTPLLEEKNLLEKENYNFEAIKVQIFKKLYAQIKKDLGEDITDNKVASLCGLHRATVISMKKKAGIN